MAKKIDEKQNALREQYRVDMNKVWNGSQHMVDYCVKKAVRFVPVNGDCIIAIEKPKIETKFCFGYSDSRYDTEDYDRANDMAYHARTSVQYFIHENMRDMKKTLSMLRKIRRGNGRAWFSGYGVCSVYIGQKYSTKNSDSKAYYYSIGNIDRAVGRTDDAIEISMEDLDELIMAYKIEVHNFHKRVYSYLKRYGLSKVESWSYWQDR